MSMHSPERSLDENPPAHRVLRVLHLEDDPLDAELIAEGLATGGLDCRISVVDDEKAFTQEASRGETDLILADHSLPAFDGLSALRIARTVCPSVPFLFVSGAIGEEQAIETLKAGAVDYVLKQRLDRLVPAVRRALREAEERTLRRQAQDALRRANDELEIRVQQRTGELAQVNSTLQAEIAERRRAEAELRRANKALRILSECNQALIRTSDEADLLNRICEIAVEFGGYKFAWVGRAEHDPAKTVRVVACAGCTQALLDMLDVSWADVERGRGPTGTAIRTSKPVVMRNVHAEPSYPPWRSQVAEMGIGSSVSLPLMIDGQVFGAMSICAAEPDGFDDAEVSLLHELTDDLAFGLSSLRARVERQKAVEALQMSEERYRRIVQTAEEGIWVLDENDVSAFVNQKMADLLGYAIAELLGRPILEFVHEWDRLTIEAALTRRRRGIKDSYDVRFLRKDRTELWTIIAGAPIFDESAQYMGSLMMVTDITERKRLERDVAEISSLEQQRIGRDLHDVLGQNLTGISFLSKILEQKLASLSLPAAADAAEIGRLSTLTNHQARSLARGLTSVGLTAGNFASKIEDFAVGVQDIFGVACVCQCDSHVRIPNDDAAVHLYRIAQEAVNNAVRHGKARNIMIQLAEQEGQGFLMIQDDGAGMPREMEKHQGMGLQIMNYRASAIGGTLKIRSAGHGTVVICSFRQ